MSGDANFDIQGIDPPSGDAQITDLNLVLEDSINASFALGLLTASTAPGDVTISLATPGDPGTITNDGFSQLDNSLALGGDLNIIDLAGVAGGSLTIDLSTLNISPTDFTAVSITQVDDVLTVSGSFTVTQSLNLPIGPTPMVVSGTFVATGEATAPVLRGDVSQNGTVDMLDISPFILILASGQFQEEADLDQNETVNYLDIGPFASLLILILFGQ